MINTIDLKRIYSQVWGFAAPPFPDFVRGIPQKTSGSFTGKEFAFEQYTRQEISEKGVSYFSDNTLGNEVFMPVWLSEVENNALQYLLPNTSLSMTNKKNVVIENLVNRKGTVKEEISIGDWEIRIRGVIIGKGNDYPEKEKQMLTDWWKKHKTFYIQNVRTAVCLTNSEKVLITNVEFPEIRGFVNTQPYELRLLSDLEFSLYIV